MKVVLLINIFCMLLYCVTTQSNPLKSSKILINTDTKKEGVSRLQKNIQIVNSRKVLKSNKIKPVYFNPKRPSDPNKNYTVFPPVGDLEKKFNVPYIANFQLDDNPASKTRVKKVLPEYEKKPLLRNKRSPKEVETENETSKRTKSGHISTNDKKSAVNKKDDKKSHESKSRTFLEKSSVSKTEKKVTLGNTNENRTKSDSKHRTRAKISRSRTNKKSGHSRVSFQHSQERPTHDDKHERIKIDIKYKSKPEKSRQHKRSKHGNKERKTHSVSDKTHKVKKEVKKSKRSKSKNKRYSRKDVDTEKNFKKSSEKSSKNKQQKKVESRRLIAARDALIEDFPYVVSIQKDGEHWCTGALLNQRLVITTANCIWKSSHVSHLRVRAGSRHLDRGGQMAKIQEVMKHPKWSIRKAPDNDLALLLLDRNIKFSDNVHAVDLPNRVMLPAFEDAWVTSWGADRRDGVYEKRSQTLQVFHSRLMDRDKCNNVTHRFGVHVTENFICLTQTARRAPCTRDTGAPAVSDGVLWGLASWGLRKLCGTERYPAIFSYTASNSNMDFIMNATHLLMSEERHPPFLDRYPVTLRSSRSSSILK